MSKQDKRAGERAAWQAWVASGCPIADRELSIVPPCRECGKVPEQYSRFSDGTVQCLNYRQCYEGKS